MKNRVIIIQGTSFSLTVAPNSTASDGCYDILWLRQLLRRLLRQLLRRLLRTATATGRGGRRFLVVVILRPLTTKKASMPTVWTTFSRSRDAPTTYPWFKPLSFPNNSIHIYQTKNRHSAATIAVVLKLHDLGYSSREISTETSVPKTTVLRIIQQRESYSNRHESSSKRAGRPNKFSQRAERLLLRHMANNP